MAETTTEPRHRPKIPMEGLVDKEAHPVPRRIPTARVGPEATEVSMPWVQKISLVLLVVFVLALSLAGFLGAARGSSAGLGFLGLALGSAWASYLLGTS